MKILAIETSCDETAIAIIEVKNEKNSYHFKILGNDISSQATLHAQYGGVYPMMAKREHGRNILHILEKVLKKAKMYHANKIPSFNKNIDKILSRENELRELWPKIMPFIKKPKIDAIAVTSGPGLEPALWVGISFAKALSAIWDVPVVPVNHMEGHIFSIFPKNKKAFVINKDKKLFPMLSLLVSGGHTELVLIKDWHKYKKIGSTRDDAVGEAFDKVARMLELPYPGGPQISFLAQSAREDKFPISNHQLAIKLPRPMIYSKDYDFSFSGIKTAVLYKIRDIGKLTDIKKKQIAKEFENSVVEVLTHKTFKALKEYKIKTLIVGGGVSANKHLQKIMTSEIKKNKIDTKILFPSKKLTGDNALMIAIAGYFLFQNKKYPRNTQKIKAEGNLSF